MHSLSSKGRSREFLLLFAEKSKSKKWAQAGRGVGHNENRKKEKFFDSAQNGKMEKAKKIKLPIQQKHKPKYTLNSALVFAATNDQSKCTPLVAKGVAESFCYFLRKKVKVKKWAQAGRGLGHNENRKRKPTIIGKPKAQKPIGNMLSII